ncbi:hypothetical protein RHGRI_031192 [Rhododendron griersonianum]|uniref:Uncharacterized protein n=1 Tax=Rhododendron griersonianum TaxID=479676 RepID=A0AAV6I7F6_9ERIC|nr:hypothetical protein RHGRI_031192 [Rhododendron griersonianum]
MGDLPPNLPSAPEYISPFSSSPVFGCEKCEPDLGEELSLLGLQIREEVDLPSLGVPLSFTNPGSIFTLVPSTCLLLVLVLVRERERKRRNREDDRRGEREILQPKKISDSSGLGCSRQHRRRSASGMGFFFPLRKR